MHEECLRAANGSTTLSFFWGKKSREEFMGNFSFAFPIQQTDLENIL